MRIAQRMPSNPDESTVGRFGDYANSDRANMQLMLIQKGILIALNHIIAIHTVIYDSYKRPFASSDCSKVEDSY